VSSLWKFPPLGGPGALLKSPHPLNSTIQALFLQIPKVFLVSAILREMGGYFFLIAPFLWN
jgi:hypothetical protein